MKLIHYSPPESIKTEGLL